MSTRQFELTPVAVKELRDELHLTQAKFARLTGTSERTVANWEKGIGQPREMSEQHLIQLYRVCKALLELVRDDLGIWFEKPNAAFDGLKPIEVIERGEVDRIWQMIYELRTGMPG